VIWRPDNRLAMRTPTCMRTASTPRRLLASLLGILLVSCSATRSSVPNPTNAQELSRLVLVIKQAVDGQVTHSWEPLSGFDGARYSYRASSGTFEGSIVRAARTRDCDEELYACVNMCVKSLRGRNWTHASRGSKDEICRRKCLPAYDDCCRLRDQAEALKFTVVDEAVAWLKQHREELLVGTVVIIAGVAFVAVVAGSGGGALILAPAVLLVSADIPSELRIEAVQP
jgi:hypothetical protein